MIKRKIFVRNILSDDWFRRVIVMIGEVIEVVQLKKGWNFRNINDKGDGPNEKEFKEYPNKNRVGNSNRVTVEKSLGIGF